MMISSFKIFFIIVIISIIGYGLWEARTFVEGPLLSITTPIQGAVTTNGFIVVSGDVARVAALSIDNLPVLPNKNGSFSKTFVFPRGNAILNVTVTDRFGRTDTETRTIFSH